MRKFFLFLFIPFFSVVCAQQSTNRFEQEERFATENQSSMGDRSMQSPQDKEGGVVQKGPGNPGAPVPIDNYIPFLLLTAVGLIIYQVRKQKQLN